MGMYSKEQFISIAKNGKWKQTVQMVPTYNGSNYDFFDFRMVQKWHTFSRNHTLNFEFWIFLG